jgi:uncharacterized protein YidB (DUF937 family)
VGILDDAKGAISSVTKGGAQGGVAGAVQGAAQGAVYGNPVGGAISGLIGSGHPLLQMFLPMLLSSGSLGLGGLLKRFHHKDMAKQADSWVAKGPNDPITPQQVHDALGADMIAKLATDSGLSEDDVTAKLSTSLPSIVDHLTPGGTLPSEAELEELLKTVPA